LSQKSSTLVTASSKSSEREPSLDIYHAVTSSLQLSSSLSQQEEDNEEEEEEESDNNA
jgi:hypothetical protein